MIVKRVETHQIKENKAMDQLCFKCKNLYNKANFVVRQRFIETSKEVEQGKKEHAEWIRYNELDKLCKQEDWTEYRELPAQTAQQTLKLLEKNWKSFFQSIKQWKKHPEKFKNRPKLPSYKHKERGRSVAVFTNQQAKVKNGFVCFPKSVGLEPVKTKIENGLQQVRIIPGGVTHTIEIVYKKEITTVLKVDSKRYLGIDLGINNITAMVSNDVSLKPLIVNGRPLKSMNQFYNKEKARLMSFVGGKGTSKRIEKLTHKRNQKVNDFMHKTSRLIVDYARTHQIGTIIIGKNDGWKQEINIGKKNNQSFVQIPFNKLIEQIEYKSEEIGITVIQQEESYTSKCSFFDSETVEKHDSYVGKRVKRGLFLTGSKRLVNADINGSANIIRKVVPNAFADGIEGVGLRPLKILPS